MQPERVDVLGDEALAHAGYVARTVVADHNIELGTAGKETDKIRSERDKAELAVRAGVVRGDVKISDLGPGLAQVDSRPARGLVRGFRGRGRGLVRGRLRRCLRRRHCGPLVRGSLRGLVRRRRVRRVRRAALARAESQTRLVLDAPPTRVRARPRVGCGGAAGGVATRRAICAVAALAAILRAVRSRQRQQRAREDTPRHHSRIPWLFVLDATHRGAWLRR
mmetsp:Transcript_34801/g.107709  ORF Transcript_34801/g.107709 Transcript_34801/m.107709 type:complete len:222 (+) Transcript_34801:1225-1890(+)